MRKLYLIIILFLAALQLPIAMADDLRITVSGAGYVTSGYPSYITCDGQCTSYVPPGAEITLTATSYGDSPFAGWGGACSGTESRCTLVMDGDRDVTATFTGQVVKEYELTAYRAGNGKGTIESEPSGVYVGSTFSYDYNNFAEGTTVTLTATPNANSKFVGWSGDCSSTDGNKCTITMNSDKQATAEFASTEAVKYTLTIKKSGTGSGIISSSKNIRCGDVCYEYVNEGESVVLTATPDASSSFDGWSGDCSGTGTCTITANLDLQATATFSLKEKKAEPIEPEIACGELNQQICDSLACAKISNCYSGCKSPYVKNGEKCAECPQGTKYVQGKCASESDDSYYTLAVTRKGPGTVTAPFYKIYCGQYCSAMYRKGSMAELTAYPDEGGARFSGWEGNCTGTGSKCALTFDGEKKVTANFKGPPAWYKLKINLSGDGIVVSGETPSGINCGTICSKDYLEETTVELLATPKEDKKFKEWQGACIHNNSVCSVTMDGHKSVNVVFADVGVRKLRLSFIGNGTVYFPGGPRGAMLPDEFVNEKMKSGKFKRFCKNSCTSEWQTDAKLRLVPDPAEDYEFEGWEGACSGNGHCILPMSQHREATAKFKKLPPRHNVTINVTGSGLIKSSDNKINCSGFCIITYFEGTPLNLNVHPDEGMEFASWGGDCKGSGKECKIAINSDKIVNAEFRKPAEFTLSVAVTSASGVKGKINSSDGKVNCENKCNYAYRNGTKISLAAIPHEYWDVFKRWHGDCTGRDKECKIIMDSNKSVTAVLGGYYDINISLVGNGKITAYFSHDIIGNCQVPCVKLVRKNSKVSVQLFKEGNTVFHNISGDCPGISSWGECPLLTMDSDKEIIIDSTHTAISLKLNVVISGQGRVESISKDIDCGQKCEKEILYKDSDRFYAYPAEGWQFARWEGACTGTDSARCTALANEIKNLTVTAVFEKYYKLSVVKSGNGKGKVVSTPAGINCDESCRLSEHRFIGPVTLEATPSGNNRVGWTSYDACYRAKGNTCAIENKDYLDTAVMVYFDECYEDDHCQWSQYCDYNYFKCKSIPCPCGEIQNRQCVKHECCSDSDCKDGKTCKDNFCFSVEQCFDGKQNQGESSVDCGGPCELPCGADATNICAFNAPRRFQWNSFKGLNYMTSVKNQQSCGSCWAFAAVGAIEGVYQIEKNNIATGIDLSEQTLVSCSTFSCNGGYPDWALDYVKNNGIVDESCFRYQSGNCMDDSGKCKDDCSDWWNCKYPKSCDICPNGRKWKIQNYQRISSDRDSIKMALMCYGPLVVWSDKWKHAIVLVGWDEYKGDWIIKNQWDTGWGENGYGRIAYSGEYGDLVNNVYAVRGVG